MERNKKYHSNYFSHSQLLNSNGLFPQELPRVESQTRFRPQMAREIDIVPEMKQNSAILRNSPFQNEYSFMGKYKKLDQFGDIESYFANLYGQRKNRRAQFGRSFEQNIQRQRQQRLILPLIMMKKRHCMHEEAMYKHRIQQLEDRLNKMSPFYSMDCNHLPPICPHMRQRCNHNHCSQCGNGVVANPVQQAVKTPQSKQEPKQQAKEEKPQKPRVSAERRKKLLSRFRVIGYAVYFAVIFPHYSYLFAHFKLKQFLEKYLVQENSYIRQMNTKLQERMKEIPIYQSIRAIHQQHEQDQRRLQVRNPSKDQEPKIKISNQLTDENYVINLNVFKKIVTMIIKTYDAMVDTLDEEMVEFLGVGVLNTSYYGDEIYAIEEMPFIYCHPEKGNVRLNRKQEKALMLSNFIIKRVIYQNLVRLSIDPEWHEELATFSQLNKSEVAFFKLICKQIQLCALFIYEMAIKNFYELIDSEQPGNFLEQSDTSLPLPIKTMRFPSFFMTSSEKQIFNQGFGNYMSRVQETNMDIWGKSTKSMNKSKKFMGSVQKFYSKYNWKEDQKQIFDQYTLLIEQDPLNLVHNHSQFGQLSGLISQHMKSSYEKIEKSMLKIVEKLNVKIQYKKRKNYKRYHERVMRKKYILTKQHDILQGVVFLRNEEEKKLVAITRKMLQIYGQTLEQHEIQVRDRVSDLGSKKEMLKNKNYSNSKSGSVVSIESRIMDNSRYSSSSVMKSKLGR